MDRPSREKTEAARALTLSAIEGGWIPGGKIEEAIRVLLAATAEKPVGGCDECDDGIVLADTCPTCDQEIWKTCGKCGGVR